MLSLIQQQKRFATSNRGNNLSRLVLTQHSPASSDLKNLEESSTPNDCTPTQCLPIRVHVGGGKEKEPLAKHVAVGTPRSSNPLEHAKLMACPTDH